MEESSKDIPKNQRLSRRRLLGAAAISGSLPVVHQLISHRGLHPGVDSAVASGGSTHVGALI